MCAGKPFALFVVLGAAAFAVVDLPARAETINIPSAAGGWETRIILPGGIVGTYVGQAQNVCLRASPPVPANCPINATPPGPATEYGYSLSGWSANLSGLPDPKWIWAPGITGNSRPAEDQSYSFKSTFLLCGAPMDGEVWLSADNRADVYVNGTKVLSNANNAVLDHYQVPAALLRRIPGYNEIEIKATNDPNPPMCGQGTSNTNGPYSCNPAGVVFNGRFEDALNPWPTCTATMPAMPSGQMIYHVGESEDLGICPAGWTGRIYHTCACSFDATGTVIGTWGMPVNTCAPPPPPPPRRKVCLNFDALPAAVFGHSAGQVPGDHAFTDQGVSVSVEVLPTPASSLFEDVRSDPLHVGAGAGQSVRFQNASLRFDLSGLGFTPATLSFEFDYKGGDYSFATDSSPSPSLAASKILDRPVPSSLPGIGASAVSIAQVPTVTGGTLQAGTMTLSGGSPRWFEIGGQELWIDDLCISE